MIKRLSPDGRIDSISIEISIPLAETLDEIKVNALTALTLQTEIATQFLQRSRKALLSATDKGPGNNGAVFARVLDVGVSDGQFGRRFYLNVNVNGRRARFFGTAAKVAQAVSALDEELIPDALEAGMRIDLPCRVLTERSDDGRYLNVTHILPPKPNGQASVRS